MTIMQASKRRTRFGKLLSGTYFMYGKDGIIYHKTDNEHAISNSLPFRRFVFAEKALVRCMIFKTDV